jgi:hypothetical protein
MLMTADTPLTPALSPGERESQTCPAEGAAERRKGEGSFDGVESF